MTRTGFHFDEGRHVYSWNGEHIPGATTILKQQDTLIGGDLAIWGGGLAADHILGRKWAVGATHDEIRESAMKAVTAKRDIGTLVHKQIENILAQSVGLPPVPSEPTPETAPYVYAFASFLTGFRPEFLAVEQRVVNLTERYAGTFDFLARINGRVAMADVKTGALKVSHKLQLASYTTDTAIAIEGSTDTRPIPHVDDHYVLLLRPDSYELIHLGVDDADREHFIRLVRNYHAMKSWDRQAAFPGAVKEAA